MRRYFVRHLDTAIVESPMTAQAAARYAAWREVTLAEARKVWRERDRQTLAVMRPEAAMVAEAVETAPLGAKVVGGHIQ